MSSKEIKNALKAAREAIRNKEFKEALQQCKAVLAEDENNYNALVFVGVAAEAMEQYDQALKAYHRATEVSPDQLLAWQGLTAMHNKNPKQVPKEDAIKAFEKLVELLASEKDKQQDAMKKLILLFDVNSLGKVMLLCDNLKKEGSESDRDILKHLINILQHQPQLSDVHEAKLLSCIKEVLAMPDDVDQETDSENLIRSYLQLLQKRDPEVLFGECSRLADRFPSLSFPLDVKLRLLLDRQMVDKKSEEVEEIRKILSLFAEMKESESSVAALLAEGYLSFLDGKYPIARDALQNGVKKMSGCFCGLFYLAQVLFKLHSNTACLSACQQALLLLTSKNCVVSVSTSSAKQQLQEMEVHCYMKQGSKASLTQALDLLNEMTEGGEKTDILQAYIYLQLSDKEQLQVYLDKLENREKPEVTALLAWVDFHQENYSSAMNKLRKCVSEDSTNAEYLFKLGRALWEQRLEDTSIPEQCFNTLLKAAKLDPYCSGTFLYLGHFYTELKKDQQRGMKCYQKAYDLDPDNEEAGAALCDMMATQGQEEKVQSLLQKVTGSASAGCAKWAWLRLGLAQVRAGDPSTAIASFQSALRADPNDRHVWECLAEAYLHRGSFIAALKAFTKSAELQSDSIYSLYQIATIKQKLGELREAAEEYKVILDKSSDYVPALKGLGETYLMVAKHQLAKGLLGLALDFCQQAIACLTRAATHRPDLSCLWKLMGDSCTALHSLHAPSLRIRVPCRLCQTGAADSTENVEIGKLALLELGTKCYQRALKILPESPPLWHDLGIGLFYLCQEKSVNDGKPFIEKCIHALKRSLSLDPTNHLHWTSLGVAAASQYAENPALAQHCFIKSIECEANNAIAWTNLGALYLCNDKIELAHKAFQMAQSLEPEYIGCWIGQALIAEIVNSPEAMDLFRHTTELGIHMESCLGYGHWVVTTLLDTKCQDTEAFQYCIKQMAAIPAAADALIRYTEVMKDDARAFNMLGLLHEHQRLHQSALHAFNRAAELAEKCGITQEEKSKIQLNIARLLSKTQQYEKAVLVYETSASGFHDICQWALALYYSGRLQDSNQVYEKALSMAEAGDGTDKSDVCAAMAMVAFKSGNLNDAKTLLFQGFESGGPSLQGLEALCTVGLMQGDMTVAQATLKKLSQLAKAGDKLFHVASLTAAFNILQGSRSEAMTNIEQLLTDNPESVGLYLLMSSLGLHSCSGYTAESSAMLALTHGAVNDKDILLTLALSQLYVGKHSVRQPADNALRTALKTFHLYPDDVSVVCCLASAVHGEGVIQHTTKGDNSLFLRELGLLDIALSSPKVTAEQRVWCLKQKAVTHLIVGDSASCGSVLQQLQTECPQESELALVLQCVLTNNQAELEPLVIRDGCSLFFWQILLVQLMKGKRWSEAGVVLREALQRATSYSGHVVDVVCLVMIAWAATQQVLTESGSSENLVAELEEASQTVSQLSDQPYTLLQVLQAVVHLHSNPRKAKHHFANALEPGNMASHLGTEVSLARRGIISFLHQSGKDQELAKKILSDAEAGGDAITVDFYKKLYKS